MDGRGQFGAVFAGVRSRVADWAGGLNRGQPWPVRAAALTFFIVLAIPIAALIILAAMVAAVVFGVLLIARGVAGPLGRLAPRRDGRQNVRVIQRDDSGDRIQR